MGFNKKITQDEARRCPQCATATCLPGCPLGIDIPGFIRFLREGDATSALERIKKENPFPAICGRVCPAPCEQSCVFEAEGEPISIRALERFASDFGQSPKGTFSKTPTSALGKKVAIIGSGPAGMTAAYYLAKAGLGVSILEAAHEPGGMLRYGIPEFRLPQKVLDEQFAQLKALGVEVQTDVIFNQTMRLDEILMRGFATLLLATGQSLPRFSDLPGSSLGGVYYDTEFLNRLQAIQKEDVAQSAKRQDMPVSKTVVIGSGSAAFDAARVSARLGHHVQVIFEGLEEQAGVDQEILKETAEEGIEIHPLQALEIVGDGQDFVQGVKCRKLDIIESEDGLRLVPSSEEPVVLEAATVVIANGRQSQDLLKHIPSTSQDKVFTCGGDSVVEAMAHGKTTAQKIIQYLNS